MGGSQSSPWRETRPFKEEAKELRKELGYHRKTELRITLVGQTGVGKSSLINSIFSVSKGRIADKTSAKSSNLEGVCTQCFSASKAGEEDLLQSITFYDTMGFTFTDGLGISMDQLKACLDGKLNVGHKFEADEILPKGTKNTKPHCVLLVVSAEELERYPQPKWLPKTSKEVSKIIPEDMAQIIVITKVDMVCPDSSKNIEFIYKSKTVETLVNNAEAIFGVPKNHIFPIINFDHEMYFNELKGVPIMFLLKFAFNFAKDRQENDTN